MRLELQKMYHQDQEDRAEINRDNPDFSDWQKIKKRDDERKEKVENLYKKGLIKTAEDMFYAGMIYQHGGDTESFKKAIELSKKSYEMGSDDGKWLYPRAEDRYLLSIGKAQIWGTQFTWRDGKWVFQEPFDKNGKTEKERAVFNVNPEKQLKEINER
jgi:hypothetical protein